MLNTPDKQGHTQMTVDWDQDSLPGQEVNININFYKEETYSFPIANGTQPTRYIRHTATGSLGRAGYFWGLNIIIIIIINTAACMPM